MTDSLVSWLYECIDEDEQVALDAAQRYSGSGGESWHAAVDVGDEYNISVVGVDGSDFHAARCAPDCHGGEDTAAHIARWDPARVLAEVESKRAILRQHHPLSASQTVCAQCWDPDENSRHPLDPIKDRMPWPCSTARALLMPYEDRPGYDPAWSDGR